MAKLNDAARQIIESGALAHMVTLNADGSPQVAVVWMGFEGDTLVAGHLDGGQRKLANLRRDPRVSVSFEAGFNEVGTRDHIVVHGTAEITEGGAPELLNRLAKRYIGPEAEYPPIPDPPEGFVTHITINRVSGVGDWAA